MSATAACVELSWLDDLALTQLERQREKLEREIIELEEELRWKQKLLEDVRQLLEAKTTLARSAIAFRTKAKPPWP